MNIEFIISDSNEYSLDYLLRNKKIDIYEKIEYQNLDELINNVVQIDIFNTKKNYVIFNLNLDKKDYKKFIFILEKLKKLDDDFYFLILETNKSLITFIESNFNNLIKYIPKFNLVNKRKYVVDYIIKNDLADIFNDETIEYLISILPNEFISLKNELQKINLLNNKKVSEEEINSIIFNSEEENLFFIVEKILYKDYVTVSNFLNNNNSDQTIIKIISLLANYLYKLFLYKIVSKHSKSVISSIFSSQWEIKKIDKIQKIYNILEIEVLNKKLFILDYNYKNGIINNLYNAFKFLLLKKDKE